MPAISNVGEFVREATKRLQGAGIPTARLDCLILLEDQTDKDRSWLLAHPEHPLTSHELKILDGALARRSRHVPLAYIRGRVEFYGRDFTVNPHTLVPRPETETMIEMLKRLQLPAETRILDVGTGSGCIAVTAALELPAVTVSASDIDAKCLSVAKHNADTLGANVIFYESNLLEQVDPGDLIAANLPYVPENFQINTAATHEPRHALFAGADGLDLYRKLFSQLDDRTTLPRYVLAESLPPQHEKLTQIAKVSGYALRTTEDFIQLFEYC